MLPGNQMKFLNYSVVKNKLHFMRLTLLKFNSKGLGWPPEGCQLIFGNIIMKSPLDNNVFSRNIFIYFSAFFESPGPQFRVTVTDFQGPGC